ncbi:hypothetical protein D3C78_1296530 [compost metagenome]
MGKLPAFVRNRQLASRRLLHGALQPGQRQCPLQGRLGRRQALQYRPCALRIQRLDEQAQGFGEGLFALLERLLGRRQLRGEVGRQGDSGLSRHSSSQDAGCGQAERRIRGGHDQAVASIQ